LTPVISVIGIIGCQAIVAQINAQATVVVDGIALNPIARAGVVDQHANAAVEGNGIACAYSRPTDSIIGGGEVN
jgi:hypothetical protein